jgi:hypothetical protein
MRTSRLDALKALSAVALRGLAARENGTNVLPKNHWSQDELLHPLAMKSAMLMIFGGTILTKKYVHT